MNNSKRCRVRMLIVMIGLLLCSNFATALVAYLSIKRLDENYSKELDTTSSGLQQMVLLSHNSTDIHRAAGNMLLARNRQEMASFRASFEMARKKESNQLAKILATVPPTEGSTMEPLWLASRRYSQGLEEFLTLVERGDMQAAKAYRLDKLRPTFGDYQDAQEEQSVRLNREAVISSHELTSTADSLKKLLIGFGGWPFAVFSAMMVGATLLGAGLWRHLRQIEHDEKSMNVNRHF